jgi:hypothetical protein
LEIDFISKRNKWQPHTKISRQQLFSIKSPKGIELNIEDPTHSNRRLLVKQGNKNQKM